MARKDASLELRKARNSTGQLELNQSEVVRLVGILNGTTMPPRLSASPGLVLESVLAGTPNRSSAMLGGTVVIEGAITSRTACVAQISGAMVIECAIASASQTPDPAITGEYDQNVFRGPASSMGDAWELAISEPKALSCDWQKAGNERATSRSLWQQAASHQQQVGEYGEQMPPLFMANQQRFAEGEPVSQQNNHHYDSLAAGHVANQSLWVESAPVGSWRLVGFTNPPRFDKVWQACQWQDGTPIGKGAAAQAWHHGSPLIEGWRDGWDDAMLLPAGKTKPPEPPKPPVRPDKRTLRLEFGRKRGEATLEFVWHAEHTVVIPTRRVYFVSNSASIVRARDGRDIAATAVSVDLDTDSWAWQFSATLPSIADAEAVRGEEVFITINGYEFVMKVDSYRDNRSWGQQGATIGGRGLSAYLSSDYVVESSYIEPQARTMAQLAAEQLPNGWVMDWRASDWLVPGGVFSFERMAPISVIQLLAESAAAWVLPDPVARKLTVKPRYPAEPWKLDTATPDIVIPDAIMLTLASDHINGKLVNGIYVAGRSHGINGKVVRQGSGGDRLLPPLFNDLCVDVVAARALGIEALAKAGQRTTHEIELPVSSDTGLILPGMIAETSSGRGYTRGLRLSAKVDGDSRLVTRQQITIERPGV